MLSKIKTLCNIVVYIMLMGAEKGLIILEDEGLAEAPALFEVNKGKGAVDAAT